MQSLRTPLEVTANTARRSFQLGIGRTVHYMRFVISPISLCLPSFDVIPRTQQTLQRHAADIAATYTTNREDMQKVATDMRLPFWDWARHALPPPQFYDHRKFPQVTIIKPDGSRGPVENPLLGYRFKSGQGPAPPPESFSPAYWKILKAVSQYPGTTRHPAEDGTSDIGDFER